MTVQRDPQLIARIIEMRDARMTRAQARHTLDMGEHKFDSIIREYGIDGWARHTPEAAEAEMANIRRINKSSREKAYVAKRMLQRLTPKERERYRTLRELPPKDRPGVLEAFRTIIKDRGEET